ncbi:MAG: prepilin-type N-terminal cleavage/methylation domain-containing protein [Desulfuromonadaceae bacterium]|nr:prepilin-type N-terminal cleavage/methylation domain-containing protein [Desulfuromonadaceae bacterium]
MINKNSGFTLIEFLVAIVILMIGLLGMLSGVNLAIEKTVETSLRNEAITLADERMMHKRAKAFSALSTGTTNAPQSETSRFFRGVYKNYSVQEIVTQSTPNSKEIILNVSWKFKNRKSTHSISSFVSTTPQ